MNYNRRAHRPNGNHYRDMRRRGLKRADEGGPFRRGRKLGWGSIVVAVLVFVAFAVWIMSR